MWTRAIRGIALLAASLVLCGCGGDPVGPQIARLQDADVEVRRAAALALGENTEADDRTVAALTHSVGDIDFEVRRLSLDALGRFGGAARSSLPAIKRALDDPEPPVRVGAALAIRRIDSADTSFQPVLVAAMRKGDGPVMLAVGAMGEDGAWAAPTLKQLLSHELPQIRALAAQTLGRIGPAASIAKVNLQALTRDSNLGVASAAEEALRRIEASAPPASAPR